MEKKFVSFTRNFTDKSTEAGFQYAFLCDSCRDGYTTKFVQAKSYKKRSLFRGIGKMASVAGSLSGRYGTGYGVERGADAISERWQGMSPEWHKEHEQVFQESQNEAMGHFNKCPRCKKWVCEECWNEEEGLCVDDAPRVAVEVAAAKAAKAKADIMAKAAETQVFKGEITTKQTICPTCGKPAGASKFCNNCGAPLGLLKCKKCGATNQAGTKFCGECGAKLSK
jgi:hypothetical protein